MHPALTKKQVKAKEWISPNSEAFKALQKIVSSKNILNDLTHLTKFCHTGVLEADHSLYNKWAPKRQHFSYTGMITQSQLAVMDFNEGSKLEQATTQQGDKRYKLFKDYQKLVFEAHQRKERSNLSTQNGKRNN